jgi:hypothetical protein
MIRHVVGASDDFLAGLEIPDADVVAVFQAHGVGHLQFLRALELLVRLCRRERIFDGKSSRRANPG